jgi:hypothetical protein
MENGTIIDVFGEPIEIIAFEYLNQWRLCYRLADVTSRRRTSSSSACGRHKYRLAGRHQRMRLRC